MKKLVLFISFILSLNTITAKDMLDKIAENACNCFNEISNDITTEERNTKLGLCMLKYASPYSKELLKEYNINLEDIDNNDNAERLGKTVAMRMIKFCPEALMAFANASEEKEEETKKEPTELVQSVTGIVLEITENPFVSFKIQNDNSAHLPAIYTWTGFIETEFPIVDNYKTLVGKYLDIDFVYQYYYEPKSKSYTEYRIIRKLNLHK